MTLMCCSHRMNASELLTHLHCRLNGASFSSASATGDRLQLLHNLCNSGSSNSGRGLVCAAAVYAAELQQPSECLALTIDGETERCAGSRGRCHESRGPLVETWGPLVVLTSLRHPIILVGIAFFTL